MAGFYLGRLVIVRRKQNHTEIRLENVFEAVWLVVGQRNRRLSPSEEAKLRFGLAKLLVRLETRGVTDPRELRRLAIEELILTVPFAGGD